MKLRSKCTLKPPHPQRLPHPKLFEMASDGSHGWSIQYPAWNLMYYCLLCSLRDKGPNWIVETGTNHGCSAAVMALALRERKVPGHVYTFEVDPGRAAKAQALFGEIGVADRITLVLGYSQKTIPKTIRTKPVLFAFIDSDHKAATCLSEVNLLYPNVLAAKGKFYFDNTLCAGVDEALCQLKRKYGTGGFVEFPNCSTCPPGNVIWEVSPRMTPNHFE